MPVGDADLRIGTSGGNYPSGKGTWNGIFYPPSRGRAKTFDELAFYPEHFDTVEVNSTFYGQPRAEVTRGWADRTTAGFEFSVKLYQKFTHPAMFKKSLSRRFAESSDHSSVAAVSPKAPTTRRSPRCYARIRWMSMPSALGSSRSRRRASWAPCSRSSRRA